MCFYAVGILCNFLVKALNSESRTDAVCWWRHFATVSLECVYLNSVRAARTEGNRLASGIKLSSAVRMTRTGIIMIKYQVISWQFFKWRCLIVNVVRKVYKMLRRYACGVVEVPGMCWGGTWEVLRRYVCGVKEIRGRSWGGTWVVLRRYVCGDEVRVWCWGVTWEVLRRYVSGVEEVRVWCWGGTCVVLRRYVTGV